MTREIFLLPGLDGTGKLFAPFQSALGGNNSTITVRYKDELVFDEYVDSVAELLPARGAVLVAESFSGPIALALLARYPERINCAVLCATFAVSPFRFMARLAGLIPAAIFGPSPIQKAIIRRFCFMPQSDPAVVNSVWSVVRSVPAATIKSRLILLSKVDVSALLPKINTPVLCLQALQDKIVGAHLTRQLVQGLPKITVHTFNGPHLLLQSSPCECAKIIIPFVASNSQSTIKL